MRDTSSSTIHLRSNSLLNCNRVDTVQTSTFRSNDARSDPYTLMIDIHRYIYFNGMETPDTCIHMQYISNSNLPGFFQDSILVKVTVV
jgi:hypothetical protein